MSEMQEYDCENGVCPNCGDACLEYDEDLCTETDTAYIHFYVCPACTVGFTWYEVKDDDFDVIWPPYEP